MRQFAKNLFTVKIYKSRIYGLDILRAMAILFVLYSHGINYFKDLPIYKSLNIGRFDGVAIFFVLSGYLIGKILIKTFSDGNFSFGKLKNFWLRRWLRTLPNYFFVLIILLILRAIAYRSLPDSWFEYFFFVQNLTGAHPVFFGEAWSLSVEEWFYLLFPLAMLFIARLRFVSLKFATLCTCAVFIVFSTIMRFHFYLEFDGLEAKYAYTYIRKVVITRFDSIVFGVIMAYIHFHFPKRWVKFKNIGLVLGLILMLLWKLLVIFRHDLGMSTLYLAVFSFSLLAIGTSLVIPFFEQIKNGKGLFFKFITITSLTSYSLYLINLALVQEYTISALNNYILPETSKSLQPIVNTVLFLVLSYLGSVILYNLIEQPFMKLRDRITKK